MSQEGVWPRQPLGALGRGMEQGPVGSEWGWEHKREWLRSRQHLCKSLCFITYCLFLFFYIFLFLLCFSVVLFLFSYFSSSFSSIYFSFLKYISISTLFFCCVFFPFYFILLLLYFLSFLLVCSVSLLYSSVGTLFWFCF